jgi:hypothetical protein
MTTESRDITMSVCGVQLIVTVLICEGSVHHSRRLCVRTAGSKVMIDAVLAEDVKAEIDRQLAGGPVRKYLELKRPRFTVPTPTTTLDEVNARRGHGGGGA